MPQLNLELSGDQTLFYMILGRGLEVGWGGDGVKGIWALEISAGRALLSKRPAGARACMPDRPTPGFTLLSVHLI